MATHLITTHKLSKNMASNDVNDEVFKSKRIPKTPVKFKIQLNEEQKIAKEKILNNSITLLAGGAGSGKTLLACNVALDLLLKKTFKKIIITRPTVSKEDIGFLPGDLREKMDPWLQPIYQNFNALHDKEKMDKYFKDGVIEVVPVSFMRGRTFLDSIIIVDEAQNVTHEQMEMIVTRLGLRSKMIICGDDYQVDLPNKKESGFKFLYNASKKIKNLEAIKLLTNHRDPIVTDILKYYDEASENGVYLKSK